MSEPKSLRIPHPIWFAAAAVPMVVLWFMLAVWLPYHREQVVIREIERLGGEVETAWDGPAWIVAGPGWIQEKIDDGWFCRVRSVHLMGTAISDQELKHLSGLTNLEQLFLSYTQISDKGLKHLSGLTNLSWLWLTNTHVSDEGLKHLSGITTLIRLYVENTKVTEDGIKKLQKKLPYCEIHY